MSLSLVVGGTRSGKSARGQQLALATGRPVRYVATADGADPSMAERIALHAVRRPAAWETVEAGDALAATLTPDAITLIDGLGTWIAGVLHRGVGTAAVAAEVERLIEGAEDRDVIVVAEEAGQGLLPMDDVSRTWLDALGESVQRLSDAADRVDYVVAGRPIPLTGRRHVSRNRDAPGNDATITVVGIGAGGWAQLSDDAREAITAADEVIGSPRQLGLLPPVGARTRPLPAPLDPLLDELADRAGSRVCVLASGDPMLHGIGATLARRVDPSRLSVITHPSAFSLACARLGWPAADVELVSAVARDPAVIARVLQPGRRIVAYVTGRDGAAGVAGVASQAGYGASRFVVLEQLGGPGEQITDTTADQWGQRPADPLHAVAIECSPDGAPARPLVPGLPDDAFDHDGALTKQHVRACTLAALGPLPGALLWDVGAGNGSIAIEWLRAEPTASAVAVEPRSERAHRIERNARALGVPHLRVIAGTAPEALHGLQAPDAIFIGGGLTAEGVLDACWDALREGGRIVANAVTLESEQRLVAEHLRRGGALVRIAIAHAGPVGRFTGWRDQMPVVQWSATKEAP